MTEDVTIRAARAQQLLDDEVLQEALSSISNGARNLALQTELANPDQCVAAVACIKASQAVVDELRSFVTAGKAAERKPYKVA